MLLYAAFGGSTWHGVRDIGGDLIVSAKLFRDQAANLQPNIPK